MKKTTLCLLLTLACLLLCPLPALAAADYLARLAMLAGPPKLEVVLGGQRISPMQGNMSWASKQADGQMAAFVACGSHPLEAMEQSPQVMPRLISMGGGKAALSDWPLWLPFGGGCLREALADILPKLALPVAAANELRLEWEVRPDSLVVRVYDFGRWQERTCGNTEYSEVMSAYFVPLAADRLPLLPEGGLYVLDAVWGEDGGPGGRAELAFYIPRWPLDFNNDWQISDADWQRAEAAGACAREEFAAALCTEYGITEGEAEQLLAGGINVLCGVRPSSGILYRKLPALEKAERLSEPK